jgi:hypothetical protein
MAKAYCGRCQDYMEVAGFPSPGLVSWKCPQCKSGCVRQIEPGQEETLRAMKARYEQLEAWAEDQRTQSQARAARESQQAELRRQREQERAAGEVRRALERRQREISRLQQPAWWDLRSRFAPTVPAVLDTAGAEQFARDLARVTRGAALCIGDDWGARVDWTSEAFKEALEIARDWKFDAQWSSHLELYSIDSSKRKEFCASLVRRLEGEKLELYDFRRYRIDSAIRKLLTYSYVRTNLGHISVSCRMTKWEPAVEEEPPKPRKPQHRKGKGGGKRPAPPAAAPSPPADPTFSHRYEFLLHDRQQPHLAAASVVSLAATLLDLPRDRLQTELGWEGDYVYGVQLTFSPTEHAERSRGPAALPGADLLPGLVAESAAAARPMRFGSAPTDSSLIGKGKEADLALGFGWD